MISNKTLIKMISLSKYSSLFSLLALKIILDRQFRFFYERKLNEELEPTYIAHLHPTHHARHIHVSYTELSHKSRKEALVALFI